MDEFAYLNPPAALPAILARTEQLGFPMPSEPRTGALLRVLAASKPGGRLLELGTGTGIATAWLLDGMDAEASLVSIDIDASAQAVAREHLGHDKRVRFVTGDAAVFLRPQVRGSFDLVFADAMIGKYEMLDEALSLPRAGGLYVIDDMLPQESWPEEHAPKVPRLLDELAHRADLKLVSLAWSSGLAVAVKT
jgi:predicted O-methyltransferase YrrM